MKRILFAAALTMLAAPSALAAQTLAGNWTNPKRSVIVKVDRCGQAYCGTVSWASQKNRDKVEDRRGKELVGMQILTGLKPTGGGLYKGEALEPKRNIRGSATVRQLGNNTMVVKGCAVLGIFCKEQRWTRVVD
jgi:uncharacterized protein (DUF2147 family)